MNDINWYPGHMTKAKRMIEATLPSIDIVVELVDARIPLASKNPDITKLTASKPKLLVLNKSDLADPNRSKYWMEYYKKLGYSTMLFDSRTRKNAASSMFISTIKDVFAEKLEKSRQRGIVGKAIRIMVLGIPNVGKSTFINNISGQKVAKAEDRPGVTRGKQWITLPNGIVMLDMPGILWPRLDVRRAAENLAITGAIKDNVLDTESLAMILLGRLKTNYESQLRERYKLDDDVLPDDNYVLLSLVAIKRGFLVGGGKPDTERAAIILLDEFRASKIGRITLDIIE